jgi:hypothetical protein
MFGGGAAPQYNTPPANPGPEHRVAEKGDNMEPERNQGGHAA